MRKTILLFALSTLAYGARAQENMMSKRGTPILPEVGDYAIFFDADPFLSYVGNLFNQSGNNSISADFTSGNPFTITGLYVNNPNSAYRGKVRLGFQSSTQEEFVLVIPNTNNLTTVNKTKVSASNITIGVGMQKSRGKHRLRGNYGADVMIMYGSGSDTTYSYGQALAEATQTLGPRPVKSNTGSTFGLGLRGFISVEYFIAPKISFTAQYGWGISVVSQGKGKHTDERFDSPTNAVVTDETKIGRSSFFGADVDNNGASIAIGFYF